MSFFFSNKLNLIGKIYCFRPVVTQGIQTANTIVQGVRDATLNPLSSGCGQLASLFFSGILLKLWADAGKHFVILIIHASWNVNPI
jgi:hypothetical protein